MDFYFFSKGEPFVGFVGAPISFSGARTSPLTVKITGFLSGVLVLKVIVLVNLPILLVAYFTLIVPDSPGAQTDLPYYFL